MEHIQSCPGGIADDGAGFGRETVAVGIADTAAAGTGAGGGLLAAVAVAKPGRAALHISHAVAFSPFRYVHSLHGHVSRSSRFCRSLSCSFSSSLRNFIICSKCARSAASGSATATVDGFTMSPAAG